MTNESAQAVHEISWYDQLFGVRVLHEFQYRMRSLATLEVRWNYFMIHLKFDIFFPWEKFTVENIRKIKYDTYVIWETFIPTSLGKKLAMLFQQVLQFDCDLIFKLQVFSEHGCDMNSANKNVQRNNVLHCFCGPKIAHELSSSHERHSPLISPCTWQGLP